MMLGESHNYLLLLKAYKENSELSSAFHCGYIWETNNNTMNIYVGKKLGLRWKHKKDKCMKRTETV
jgi:hypothetical protein